MPSESPQLHVVGPASGVQLSDLEDDDLMLLCKEQHQEAFAVLVGRYQTLVLGLACRFLGDRSLGRDVAQDVFLSLWAERERYQQRHRFRSYLVSMTIHRCQILARKHRNLNKKHADFADARSAQAATKELPLDQLVELARAKEVRDKLTQLPEKMRQVIILRFSQDLALDEIAAVAGIPLGTVKTQLFRGMKRLYQLLAKDVQ
jgi:RNA polymerase sigma-70 factor, ECF subfamily